MAALPAPSSLQLLPTEVKLEGILPFLLYPVTRAMVPGTVGFTVPPERSRSAIIRMCSPTVLTKVLRSCCRLEIDPRLAILRDCLTPDELQVEKSLGQGSAEWSRCTTAFYSLGF